MKNIHTLNSSLVRELASYDSYVSEFYRNMYWKTKEKFSGKKIEFSNKRFYTVPGIYRKTFF